MKAIALLILALLVAAPAQAQTAFSSGIQVKDTGVVQGGVSIINCTGDLNCTASGGTATMNVTAGAGSFSITTAEIDFGSSASYEAKSTVTDAGITATTKIIVVQSGIAATGRQADENEMDSIACRATPAAGSFTLLCTTEGSPTHGLFKVHYTSAP